MGFTRAATAWKAPSIENYLKARFSSASRLRSGIGWKQCWAGGPHPQRHKSRPCQRVLCQFTPGNVITRYLNRQTDLE